MPRHIGDMKPLGLDLCCGLGGWTEGLIEAGFDVIGFDVDDFAASYPGTFRRASVQQLHHAIADGTAAGAFDLPRFDVQLVVASPPCQEFSRHDQPWTKIRQPPPPNLEIWDTCEAIADQLSAPIIIENVRGAQYFKGSAVWHCGPYYFWGSVPPLMPPRNLRASKGFYWFGTDDKRGKDLGLYRDKKSRSSEA